MFYLLVDFTSKNKGGWQVEQRCVHTSTGVITDVFKLIKSLFRIPFIRQSKQCIKKGKMKMLAELLEISVIR